MTEFFSDAISDIPWHKNLERAYYVTFNGAYWDVKGQMNSAYDAAGLRSWVDEYETDEHDVGIIVDSSRNPIYAYEWVDGERIWEDKPDAIREIIGRCDASMED